MKSVQKLFSPIDAMIIGAQKAGTTSLKNYLMQHPQVASHVHKEFAFFHDQNESNNGYQFAYKKYFQNGQERVNKKIIAKHAITFASVECIKKLKEHNPEVLLIFSLRNPIDRAYSSFLMEWNGGSVKKPFSEIKNIIKENEKNNSDWMYKIFIGLSIYYQHLERIYEHFPKEQVCCFLFDDFRRNPADICKSIFRRIKVDDTFPIDVSVKYNVTSKSNSLLYGNVLKKLLKNSSPLKQTAQKLISYKKGAKLGAYLRELNKSGKPHSEMDPDTRKYLVEFFYPHNRKLERLTGFDLSHWDK